MVLIPYPGFSQKKFKADFNVHTLGTFLESPLFRNKF